MNWVIVTQIYNLMHFLHFLILLYILDSCKPYTVSHFCALAWLYMREFAVQHKGLVIRLVVGRNQVMAVGVMISLKLL